MDRNFDKARPVFGHVVVALRKESVDRNFEGVTEMVKDIASLSARRAWIEMVDDVYYIDDYASSLSARRAWIEILPQSLTKSRQRGRSPQGERG